MMHAIKVSADAKEISEDDKKRLEKDVQNVTDQMMKDLDALREKKESELREI